MNETMRTLRERRSVRKYQAKQISDAELDAILEAGLWAASGHGLQTPVMVVIQDTETLEKLEKANAAIQGNPEGHPFYGAPTDVVVLADTTSPNWLQDGSLVMGNLMNAAASVGVASCWINRAKEYFDTEEGKELMKEWGVLETCRGVGHCILGYSDGVWPAPKPRKEGRIFRP